jgi:hypothetical protein
MGERKLIEVRAPGQAGWRLYGENALAPIRWKITGAIAPKNLWRLCAGNLVVPLCRKRFGSIAAKVHTPRA